MLAPRRRTRRLVPLTAAGSLALAAVLVPGVATAAQPARGPVAAVDPGAVTIDLLGINDFHGRLEADGTNAAGAAVLAGAVTTFKSTHPNTVFVSAGDNIGASTFTSFIQQDTPTLDALNAAGLQVSALGNHEFDQGRADVDSRVLGAATFPYLAANLYDTTTHAPAYDDSFVTTVDGVRVGFVGAVTEELPSLVTPAGISTLEVKPVVPEINRVAAALTDGDETNGEADVVVALVHEGPAGSTGVADDGTFGPLISGLSDKVDAVFSGHTHQKFTYLQPVAGWAAGVQRPVVQSGSYGQNLAHISLTVDPATDAVVASSADIIPLVGPDAATYTPDSAVATIVSDAVATATVKGAVSLGAITGNVNRARQTDASENRGGESTLGNLVADVQLWATQQLGTQIAFMNPGGLRANLTFASSAAGDADGNVTYKEAATVQPFANTLVTETLTGAQLYQVLEEQWQPAGASRPFLKLGVAGLTYTYDPTAPVGARITEAFVGDAPVDLAASYKVVVNSFLASGGDNFTTLGKGTGKADSGRIDLQAFVDYFAAHTPISPDLTQRAVGVHLVPPAVGTAYLPGDDVTVNLSSLLMSGGETQGTVVNLTIGGQQVATATIDPAAVDKTDEVGRASATFTVPADAPEGGLEVVATVPSTGTTTSFLVPVQSEVVFSDVKPTDAFYDEITWMALSGITTGYDDGTFRGLAPVNRDAMAAFLFRLTHGGADAPACTAKPFPDVETSHPFCGEIAWLKAEGISTGYADGTFRPATPVARDAMAAFVYRLAEGDAAPAACTAKPFTDVPTNQPFCGQIQWLKANGLANGWSDGTFRPSLSIERQAMAAFLFRLSDGGFLDPR